MGTRAAFWIGDPRDLSHREWLGCIAWDGDPEHLEWLKDITTRDGFRQAVNEIAQEHNDFSHPDQGWPFPWDNNIFATDCTYALIDGVVQFCYFRDLFVPLSLYLIGVEPGEDEDTTKFNIPAPSAYNRNQPDSIIILHGAS